MGAGERDGFFDSAAGMTAYLSVESGGAVYLVRAADQAVGRSLFVKQGRGEMTVLERAMKLITAVAGEDASVGRDFLDVGANIGTSTIPALRQHRFGSAVCFEPEPEALLLLRANLLLNGLEDRARVFEAAVSDTVATRDLMVDPGRGGTAWIAIDKRIPAWQIEAARPVPVKTVTLDGLIEAGTIDPDRVGLLWIDAQAHEGQILEGASQLTDRGIPVVLEWAPKELELLGDPRAIEDVATSRYTHFVDLRPVRSAADYELRPGAALHDHAEVFADPEGRSFSDLLLLRLEPAVAERLNVSELLGGSRTASGDAPRRAAHGRGGGRPTDVDPDARRARKGSPEAEARRRAKQARAGDRATARRKPGSRRG